MQSVRYCLSGIREMLIFKKMPSDLKKNEQGVNEKYILDWIFTYLLVEIFLME
jgi:hypothetical protein